MAGLYEGLEEVPFKRVIGGYVFQVNNPWLVGPRRRFFVDEAKKAELAACIRETLRRIRPFVFAAAILIPIVMIGAIFWFAMSGATLTVSIVEAGGKATSYSQALGSDGVTETLAAAEGSSVTFHVSGPPGQDATVSVAVTASNGKPGTTAVLKFDRGIATINMADSKKQVVRSVRLVARNGQPARAIMIFAIAVSLALFAAYFAAIHVYSMARVRPLLAGLQPSEDRISLHETTERYATKASNKLLALMGVSAVTLLIGSGIDLGRALLEPQLSDNLPFMAAAFVIAILVAARFGYFLFVRSRTRQNTA
jgi:hypothetical protein